MTVTQIFILALLQGVTEFLPISSSGHLILANRALGYQDEGMVFDAAVHLGSLCAVLLHFRRDLVHMLSGRERLRLATAAAPRTVLVWLVLATLPLVLVGWYSAEWIGQNLRTTAVIAWATIGFGLILGVADWHAQRRPQARPLSAIAVTAMALAQVLALIPGASRAGVTMSAGLAAGLSRQTAARFSLLMAIPAVTAAGAYGVNRMWSLDQPIAWVDFWLGFFASAVGAWLCIGWFLKWVDRIGMWPFVCYRLALGALLLALL